MSIDISKSCSDYLRTTIKNTHGFKLQASHSRELVAAFFGYKSHAAQMMDKSFPLSNLEEASYLYPNAPLIDLRKGKLKSLNPAFPTALEIVGHISNHLIEQELFTGDVWRYGTFESFIMEDLLPNNDVLISDQLSGVMAGTNAYFDEPYYESATLNYQDDFLEAHVKGTYSGTNDPDKMFSGDKLDIGVEIKFYLVAGRTSFFDYDINAYGSVNDYWVDN